MTFVSGRVFSEDLRDGRRRLTRPFWCRIDGEEYVVPAGFTWDGATLPRFAWSLHGHPFDPVHLIPGLWHDAAHAGLFSWLGVTRRYSDSVYRRWIRANGLCLVKSWIEWAVVRIFGWSHWRGRPGNEQHNNTKGKRRMKRLIVIAAACAGIFAGCTVTEAEWGGESVVLDKDGAPVILADGTAQTVKQPNKFYRNQHWMDTTIQAADMQVKAGGYSVTLSGYDSKVSTNFVAFAKVTADGVTTLAERVVAACVTGGGSISLDAAKSLIGRFLGSGGDPDRMEVSVTDGKVTCTDGSCTVTGSCADGACSE